MGKPFSKEEEIIIKVLSKTHSFRKIAKLINRNNASISVKAKDLGIDKSHTLDRKGSHNGRFDHGLANHPLYQTWFKIRNDCEWNTFKEFSDWALKLWFKKSCFHRWNDAKPFGPNNMAFLTKKEKNSYSKSNPEKQKKTCLQKYGVEHYTQTDEYKERLKEVSLKKYGVEHHTKDEAVKEKMRSTNLEKYGVENAAQAEEVKNKIKQTNLEKYGFEQAAKHPLVKEKLRQTRIERGLMYDYGGKSVVDIAEEAGVSRSCMLTWIRNYGFEQALNMDKSISSIEKVIMDFLEKNNIEYSNQKQISKYFADFCIGDLIIEADGLYWHSDAINSNNNYHVEKRMTYLDQGYNPLFFREDEIKYKFDIVKSMILNKLGKSNKVGARKCQIVEVPTGAANEFFHLNHLMGRGSGKCVGLEYNGELISAIRLINRKDHTEISRFANKIGYTIQGGLSKLIKPINGEIRSFVDLRYGNGKSLERLGFELERCSPSFKWTKDYKTLHRMNFPGNTGYDHGYKKIWDCGQALYIRS